MNYEQLPGLRFSDFRRYLESPGDYRQGVREKLRNKDGSLNTTGLNFLLGRAFDVLVFQGPDEFADTYEITNRTRQSIVYETEAEAAEADLLTIYEFENIRRWRDSLSQHPIAIDLIAGCEFQKVVHSADKTRKGKVDAYRDGILIDLKTARNVGDFEYSIKRYYYDCQLAWYQSMLPPARCFLIAVQKTDGIPADPNYVRVFELSPGTIQAATAFVDRKLTAMRVEDDLGIFDAKIEKVSFTRWVE